VEELTMVLLTQKPLTSMIGEPGRIILLSEVGLLETFVEEEEEVVKEGWAVQNFKVNKCNW
jgi:hypothetical protein